jgi:hypothetical protein
VTLSNHKEIAMTTTLNAVADLDIKAAAAKLSRSTIRLMAQADLPIGRLTLAQVDAKLAASTRLSTLDKIAIKVELSRLNLISE